MPNVKTIQFLQGRYSVSYIKLDLRILFGHMKIFLTILTFSLSSLGVSAQQDRFIYLQTENTKPFFVKINNKVFNSYPHGYIIIPKMSDGVYNLVIWFAESNTEKAFSCSIDQKDAGFIIKNRGDELQLLNVQSGQTISAVEVSKKTTGVYETQTDPFSVMLANAVHDSSILRNDVAMEENTDKPVELKDSTVRAAVNDSMSLVSKDSVQVTTPVIVLDPDVKTADSVTTAVAITLTDSLLLAKDSSVSTTKDVAVLHPDSTTNPVIVNSVTPSQVDTVQTNVVKSEVTVAKNDKKKKVKKNDKAVTEPVLTTTDTKEIQDIKKSGVSDSIQVADPELAVTRARSIIKRKSRRNGKEGMELVYVDDNGITKDTVKILIPIDKKRIPEAKITDVVITIPGDDKGTVKDKDGNDYKVTREEKLIIKEANKEMSSVSGMINSDCKNFANEDDFLKMRKKMVAEDKDADMIKAAKKIFKTRCFTTEQIKNLSVLFLKDETRFQFFEAAYPFASDSDQYFTLEKQLSEENYISRFRAMIHK